LSIFNDQQLTAFRIPKVVVTTLSLNKLHLLHYRRILDPHMKILNILLENLHKCLENLHKIYRMENMKHHFFLCNTLYIFMLHRDVNTYDLHQLFQVLFQPKCTAAITTEQKQKQPLLETWDIKMLEQTFWV
jgi:hypothetical protein